jgi:hypothetical protein
MIGAVLGILAMPAFAYAQSAFDFWPLVQCGATSDYPNDCTPCDIFKTAQRFVYFVIFGIAGPLGAFMVVWAGGTILLSVGDPAKYKEGIKLLQNTLIGVALVLSAWVITNTLIKTLAPGGEGDGWNEISCPTSLEALVSYEKDLKKRGDTAPPNVPDASADSSSPFGASCPDTPDRLNLCPTRADSKCTTCKEVLKKDPATAKELDGYIRKYMSGMEKLAEQIMVKESTCGQGLKGPTNDFGVMQLQVETANANLKGCVGYPRADQKPIDAWDGTYKEKSTCDSMPEEERKKAEKDGKCKPILPTPGEIQKAADKFKVTAGWLQRQDTKEGQVCIAANYLRSLRGACGSSARGLIGGYNGGAGACRDSVACRGMQSCAGGAMKVWECPWERPDHASCNASRAAGGTGYLPTRKYVNEMAACAE